MTALLILVVGCLPAPAWANESLTTASPQRLSVQAGTSLANAAVIPLNSTTSGQLASSNAEDWYKVVLPQAGRFQISFSSEYVKSTYYGWDVSLRDGNGSELWEGSFRTGGLIEENMRVTGLAAGTYYIKVDRGYSYTKATYNLTPRFEASAAWETERNDSVMTADAIPLDTAVYGTMRNSGDEDWYKISLPAAGRLDVRFASEYVKSTSYGWDISLRDANDSVMWDGSFRTGGLVEDSMRVTGLEAGTYYIKVDRGYSYINTTYWLTPQFTASTQWETEWNDSIVDADLTPMGSVMYGTMRASNDEDWYRVELPKAGTFKLMFGADYLSSNYFGWNISLRNSVNGELASASVRTGGKVDTGILKRYLTAGTYYIKVNRGYSYTNTTYHLTPTYHIAKNKISSLASGKKAFKVKWKKKSGATGYQVRYSRSSSMKNAKVVDASKKAKTQKVKGLKAKKRYYVQVRVVKNIAGVTYYSAWSSKWWVKTR